MAQKQNLYEYVVLEHTAQYNDNGVAMGYETKLVVAPKQVLAVSEEKAGMLAIRDIPDTAVLDDCEVVVRPF